MLIPVPELIPVFEPAHPNTEEMTNACLALMERLGVESAMGLNSPNRLEWGNNFFDSPPSQDALVGVAEELGYDVLHGVEVFGADEWGATFRKVEARDPAILEKYVTPCLR